MRYRDYFVGYPDAPTARGRKQIESLALYAENGGKAFIVFIAAIPFAKGFRLNCSADRSICGAILIAIEKGVQLKSVNIYLNPAMGSVVYG